MKANEDFEKYMQFDKVCKLLLLKVSKDADYPMGLGLFCDYEDGVKVPPDKRDSVLKILHSEIKARELMGDEAYFNNMSIMAKITAYEAALDAIAAECLQNCTPDAPISWAEFKQQVATQVLLNEREVAKAATTATVAADTLPAGYNMGEVIETAHAAAQRIKEAGA